MTNGFISFMITILIYTCFYGIVANTPGDESNNELIGLATFVSITFFVNFPLCWWIVNNIVKKNRKSR